MRLVIIRLQRYTLRIGYVFIAYAFYVLDALLVPYSYRDSRRPAIRVATQTSLKGPDCWLGYKKGWSYTISAQKTSAAAKTAPATPSAPVTERLS